jgi:hypothetical protein
VAGETLAVALLIATAVVVPGCLHFHGSSSQGDLAGGGVPIAHHQGMPFFIALPAMPFHVVVGLSPKRRHQHRLRSLTRDLVQQPTFLARFPCILLLSYRQHR